MEAKKIIIIAASVVLGLVFLSSQLGRNKYEAKLEERRSKDIVSPKADNVTAEQPTPKPQTRIEPKKENEFSYSERKMMNIIGLFISEMEQEGYSMGFKRYLYQKDGFTVEVLVGEETTFEFDSRSWESASISLRVPRRDNHSLGLNYPDAFVYLTQQDIVVRKVGDKIGFREEYTFHETSPRIKAAFKNFCDGDDIVIGDYDCEMYFWNKFEAHAPKFVPL